MTKPATTAVGYAPGDVFEYESMRSTLLELSEDVFRTEVEATRDANGGPLHRHVHQEERFMVHEGVLRGRLGLRGSRLVGPGEGMIIAPGRPHTFSVETERARFEARFTPPLSVPFYFPELFELQRPGVRDLARLAHRYPREHFYLALVPPRLRRLLLRPFAGRPESVI